MNLSIVSAVSARAWLVIFAGFIGAFLSIAVYHSIVFGFFLKPISQEFGWSRANVSLAMTISSVATIVISPFSGVIIDKIGPRIVIIIASILMGFSILLIGIINLSVFSFYFIHFLISIFGSACSFVSYSKIIVRWFDKKRGIALGLSMAGVGVAGIILPNLIQSLISNFGWRWAYICLGSAIIIIPTAMAWFFLRDTPEELGLAIDGVGLSARSDLREPKPDYPVGTSVEAGNAHRQPSFWFLLLAYALLGIGTSGVYVHLVAMLTDRGVAPSDAATLIAYCSMASVAMRIGCGALLDVFDMGLIAFSTLGAMALGILSLALAPPDYFVLGLILIGIGTGAEADLMSYFVSRRFDHRDFGRILGTVFAVFALGGGVAATAMGWIYDQMGSYSLGYYIISVLVGVAAIICMALGRGLKPRVVPAHLP